MPYLLDTCALSELVAIKRDPRAVDNILRLPREELFVSSLTIGEIQDGIDHLPPCGRKDFLTSWLEHDVLRAYSNPPLPVDVILAREWGRLTASLRRRGLPMQIKDSLIAATALVHGLQVVTRNDSDFAHAGVRIFNAWK